MESQMAHAHGHARTQEQEPHIVGPHTGSEGEDEHHHEKKSVLNKVKAKARKIKDTLTNYGHGHNPDDHGLDEEDDEKKEMVEDPEIHGAPIYEAVAIKSSGQVDAGGTGRSTAMEVDPRTPNVNPDEGPELDFRGQEASKGQQRVNLGLTTVVGEVPGEPQNTRVSRTTPGTHQTTGDDPTRTYVPGQEERPGQPKVNLQRPKGSEEDCGAPKVTPGSDTPANYQTKVTDPTGKGSKEAGITPVLQSFDKMNIYDESKPKSEQEQRLPSGVQDFLTSVPTGSHDQFSSELTSPQLISTEDYLQENIAGRPSNNRDQLSPELTAPQRISTEDHLQENIAGRPSNNRDQLSLELTAPQRISTEDHQRENIADKPSNQASYTEKISSATSTIADKAISAKNVVASKLGYGEKDNTGVHEMHLAEKNAMSASAEDYGKKMDATVTEKLTPVDEKVAGAGGTVMSKMHGTGLGNEQERGVEGEGKGVSVKEYFAEKLRPGEEDRALSEVISGALHKRKVEQKKPATSSSLSEEISDALHQRKEEQNETINRPMGNVSESEEAARSLGTHENTSPKGRMESSVVNNTTNKNNTSGKGVVGKIKGAVGSWFGRGEESQGPQQSLGSSFSSSAIEGAGQGSSITGSGERRLQESGI